MDHFRPKKKMEIKKLLNTALQKVIDVFRVEKNSLYALQAGMKYFHSDFEA